MQRARLFVAAGASLVGLALPGGAAGAPLTVQVVNERGVEQGSRVTDAAGSRLTNGYGVVGLDVEPGEVISASRAAEAPEGAGGVSYSVPSPVPSLVRIVVPALPDAVDPAHDATEAWLLAAVNGERAGLGLAPLQQSGSLNRASDVYARYLFETDTFSHTALFTASVRALDQGWPFAGGYGVGEVLALAQSKEAALEGWRGSSGHWALLMSPTANVTGVARFGNRYVMSPSICVATDAPQRCEIGQSGVRVLGAPPAVPPVAGGGAGAARNRQGPPPRAHSPGRAAAVRPGADARGPGRAAPGRAPSRPPGARAVAPQGPPAAGHGHAAQRRSLEGHGEVRGRGRLVGQAPRAALGTGSLIPASE